MVSLSQLKERACSKGVLLLSCSMGMAEATMMTIGILTDTTTGTQVTTATEAIMTTIRTEETMVTDTVMVLIDTTMDMTGMKIMVTITIHLIATTKVMARFHFSIGMTEVMVDTVLLTTAHPITTTPIITVVWL